VQVAAERPRLVVSSTDPRTSSVEEPVPYARHLETQRALIKSRLVLNAVVRDESTPKLASIKKRTDPVAWLQQNLEVTNLKDTELLTIALRPGSDCSSEDQAAIVNAVVHSYMAVIADAETAKLTDRHNQLKKLKVQYLEMLKERRETLRKLAAASRRDGGVAQIERDAQSRLLSNLINQRFQVRLERAEAETILERRKKARGAASDQGRKEIDQIEERLAVLDARGKVMDEYLSFLRAHLGQEPNSADLAEAKDEIAQVEASARRVGAEVEALAVELNAPPRVRVIETAAMPRK